MAIIGKGADGGKERTMIMKIRGFLYFFIFLLSINFVGCASKNMYTRPDYTPQLWGRDYGSCDAQAAQSAGPPPYGAGGLVTMIWAQNKNRMNYYCLTGKGWKYVDEKGNEEDLWNLSSGKIIKRWSKKKKGKKKLREVLSI